jgi:hypothetical protein
MLIGKIEIFDAGDMDVELPVSQLGVSGERVTPGYVQSFAGSKNYVVKDVEEDSFVDSCLDVGRMGDIAGVALGFAEFEYVEKDIGSNSR